MSSKVHAQVVEVMYDGALIYAPTISFTSPTTGSTYAATSTPLVVAGTHTDATTLAWTNSTTGTTGSCGISGTNFSSSNITLITGSNTIVISGSNYLGGATKTLTVTYTIPVLSSTDTNTSLGSNGRGFTRSSISSPVAGSCVMNGFKRNGF